MQLYFFIIGILFGLKNGSRVYADRGCPRNTWNYNIICKASLNIWPAVCMSNKLKNGNVCDINPGGGS